MLTTKIEDAKARVHIAQYILPSRTSPMPSFKFLKPSRLLAVTVWGGDRGMRRASLTRSKQATTSSSILYSLRLTHYHWQPRYRRSGGYILRTSGYGTSWYKHRLCRPLVPSNFKLKRLGTLCTQACCTHWQLIRLKHIPKLISLNIWELIPA